MQVIEIQVEGGSAMEAACFLKSLPFFDGLSQDDVHNLLICSKTKIYPKKTSIFMHGDPANRFFIIMSGLVKLYQTTMDGNEVVLALFTLGESFGEAVVVEGASYPHSAEAVEETKVIELSARILKELASKNPEFSFRLMRSMTHHIQCLQLKNEHLAVMTTTQRVGCFLLQLCLSMKSSRAHILLPYDKHLAASHLGMKPETFSRALKDLQEFGVKVSNNDIYIKSVVTLEEFSCSNCSSSPENCLLSRKAACCTCEDADTQC